MSAEAQALITQLQLQPHPEGGFYRETYRAEDSFVERVASTAIYYLLEAGQQSRLHRIKSDEVWHFYAGGPLMIVELTASGDVIETRLGSCLSAGETYQYCVKAGHWFGAYCAAETAFSLVGCTVAPGFEFADLEWGHRETLVQQYPQAKDMIEKLTFFSLYK